MRTSSSCLWILAHVIVTSLALSENATISFAAGTSPDRDASCRIPFETLKDPKTEGILPAVRRTLMRMPSSRRICVSATSLPIWSSTGREWLLPRRAGAFHTRWRAERIFAAASDRGRAGGGCRLIGERTCRNAARVRRDARRPRRSRPGAGGSQELSPAGPTLQNRSLGQTCRILWLLLGTNAQSLRARRRTTEARLSLRDILEQVVPPPTATTRP